MKNALITRNKVIISIVCLIITKKGMTITIVTKDINTFHVIIAIKLKK